eukprot:TRINITY_DN5_c0_g1_i2.p2 TRINITY_DN5_c0_g1~~TRINITY_DN5_c0_g1_i2.p2  ORF type:complete len:252 (-),score=-4.43 TRINITY_DN5_c0_g1_i2:51-806(-)
MQHMLFIFANHLYNSNYYVVLQTFFLYLIVIAQLSILLILIMAFTKLLIFTIGINFCVAQKCTILSQYNAKGDFVQQKFTNNVDDCCNLCTNNPQCNTFTYCPRYPFCRNGNNPIPYNRCDLKYQQKVAEYQKPSYWAKGVGVDFQSGYILGKSKPSAQCVIKYGGNAKGDLLSTKSNKASTQDKCCQRCQDHWKCNVFVYCPNKNGCYNNGQVLPYKLCDLKYQKKVSQYKQPDYYYTRSDFNSGYILGK